MTASGPNLASGKVSPRTNGRMSDADAERLLVCDKLRGGVEWTCILVADLRDFACTGNIMSQG